MKLPHTFKILQQRYFITVNMANIGAVKLKEKKILRSQYHRENVISYIDISSG